MTQALPCHDDASYVSTHRWPWRAQEVGSIVAAVAAGALAGTISRSLVGIVLGLVCGAGIAFWLYRVKVSRTNTSKVVVTVSGHSVLVESDGPLGKSRADLTTVDSVGYRRFYSDEAFMIATGQGTARIPLRATKDDRLRLLVDRACADASSVSSDARALQARMLDRDFPC